MPIFGKAKKKKKQRYIPDDLVIIDRFEYTFPALDPELYITYLQRNFEKRLTLISKDGEPDNEGRVPHTDFAIRKYSGGKAGVDLWFVGTIFEIEQTNTWVSGTVGYKNGEFTLHWRITIVGLLFALVSLIGNPIGKVVVGMIFMCAIFALLGLAITAGIWMQKNKVINLLCVPRKVPQGGATGNLEGSVSHAKEKTNDAPVKRKSQGRN